MALARWKGWLHHFNLECLLASHNKLFKEKVRKMHINVNQMMKVLCDEVKGLVMMSWVDTSMMNISHKQSHTGIDRWITLEICWSFSSQSMRTTLVWTVAGTVGACLQPEPWSPGCAWAWVVGAWDVKDSACNWPVCAWSRLCGGHTDGKPSFSWLYFFSFFFHSLSFFWFILLIFFFLFLLFNSFLCIHLCFPATYLSLLRSSMESIKFPLRCKNLVVSITICSCLWDSAFHALFEIMMVYWFSMRVISYCKWYATWIFVDGCFGFACLRLSWQNQSI